MRKIVISCASMYNGGAERVLSNLSYAFAEHYDEVEYITWVKYPIMYPMHPKVQFRCIEEVLDKPTIINRMKWFRSHLFQYKPNIVVSLLTPFNMLTILSLAFSGNKVIVCERNDSKRLKLKGGLLAKWFRNFLYIFSDGILTQTESNLKSLPWYLQRKATVIYNPMKMEESYIGKALQTKKEDVIVTVGRLIKAKNHEMLIRAFKGVLDVYPSYKLHIYGTGENEESIKHYIESLNLSEKVVLQGSVNDVWDRIVSARVFAFSSNYEGMPNALLEAMCLGLPCVSTKVSGAIDVIEDYKNGILVDVGDEVALKEAMIRLIKDNELAQSIGKQASQLYSLLDHKKISGEWIKYIDKKIND